MSFSIFDIMNWTFFETKFFNYFIRESFLKDSYLLKQGNKYDKIYFIMDGTFELTTSLNYETIKNFVKYKSKKYPKYLDELNIIKSKEPVDKKKLYRFKLSIIDNRDIVGMDDYFILDDDISFINVKCLSDDAIVFSIEKNLLNNLRRKITEIDNNVKLIIKKRVEIMIQKLMIIYRVIINNPNVNTKKICLSEEFHKRRVKSALLNSNNSQGLLPNMPNFVNKNGIYNNIIIQNVNILPKKNDKIHNFKIIKEDNSFNQNVNNILKNHCSLNNFPNNEQNFVNIGNESQNFLGYLGLYPPLIPEFHPMEPLIPQENNNLLIKENNDLNIDISNCITRPSSIIALCMKKKADDIFAKEEDLLSVGEDFPKNNNYKINNDNIYINENIDMQFNQEYSENQPNVFINNFNNNFNEIN
jgi:hypothetical protein